MWLQFGIFTGPIAGTYFVTLKQSGKLIVSTTQKLKNQNYKFMHNEQQVLSLYNYVFHLHHITYYKKNTKKSMNTM